MSTTDTTEFSKELTDIVVASIMASGVNTDADTDEWNKRVTETAAFATKLAFADLPIQVTELLMSDHEPIDYEAYQTKEGDKAVEQGVLLGVFLGKGRGHIAHQTPFGEEILPFEEAVALWEEHRFEAGVWDREEGLLRYDHGINRTFLPERTDARESILISKARPLIGKAITVYRDLENFTSKEGERLKMRIVRDVLPMKGYGPADIVPYNEIGNKSTKPSSPASRSSARAKTKNASTSTKERTAKHRRSRDEDDVVQDEESYYDQAKTWAKSKEISLRELRLALADLELDKDQLVASDLDDIRDYFEEDE